MYYLAACKLQYDQVSVTHRDLELEKFSKCKYLGIMLHSRLTFQEHVNYIKCKTIGKLKLLGRIRHIIDRDTVLLCKTLVIPIYDYCDCIYFPLGANSSDILQKLTNPALHSVVG